LIYGIGIDLVEVSRIERILAKWHDRFITKVYSSCEADYCKKKAFPHIHFAAAFAVKESFLKACGIGLWMGGIDLRDIELIHDLHGKPALKTNNRASVLLREAGIISTHVSLTHTDMYANAIVILEK
jgi:holo-[acyl-carrier protein] synthase